MRIANQDGRVVLVVDGGAVDVAQASDGAFGPDPQSVYDRWAEFTAWGSQVTASSGPLDPTRLGAVAPRPRQAFGIGLNYRKHADETGQPYPEFPPTFTKFPSCIAGPGTPVVLPSGSVDWEVELVVVVGREASHVPEDGAWSYVAGLTVGQDLSERAVQTRPPAPQWSLGKSFAGFGQMGPSLVTIDELSDPDDLAISCVLNGEEVQSSRTGDLIFSVPALISRLSSIVTLFAGDVIFTGTPSGVGVARTPQRFLSPGDHLSSTIEGIGTLEVSLVAATSNGSPTIDAAQASG